MGRPNDLAAARARTAAIAPPAAPGRAPRTDGLYLERGGLLSRGCRHDVTACVPDRKRAAASRPGRLPGAAFFRGGLVRIIVPFPAVAAAPTWLGRLLRQPSSRLLWGQKRDFLRQPGRGAAGLIGIAPGRRRRRPTARPLLMASTGAILTLRGEPRRQPSANDGDARPRPGLACRGGPPYILVADPVANRSAPPADNPSPSPNPIPASCRSVSSGVGSASHLSVRALCADGRHRHAARAVSRHRACRHRPAGRADHPDVLARLDRDAHTVSAGTLRVIGTTGAARSARCFRIFHDGRRNRPWRNYALAWMVRDVRARRHAARDRRKGRRRRQEGAAAAAVQAEAGPGGRRAGTDILPKLSRLFVNADIAKWLELAHKAGIKLAN